MDLFFINLIVHVDFVLVLFGFLPLLLPSAEIIVYNLSIAPFIRDRTIFLFFTYWYFYNNKIGFIVIPCASFAWVVLHNLSCNLHFLLYSRSINFVNCTGKCLILPSTSNYYPWVCVIVSVVCLVYNLLTAFVMMSLVDPCIRSTSLVAVVIGTKQNIFHRTLICFHNLLLSFWSILV